MYESSTPARRGVLASGVSAGLRAHELMAGIWFLRLPVQKRSGVMKKLTRLPLRGQRQHWKLFNHSALASRFILSSADLRTPHTVRRQPSYV